MDNQNDNIEPDSDIGKTICISELDKIKNIQKKYDDQNQPLNLYQAINDLQSNNDFKLIKDGALRFVGVITIGDKVYYCCPKYWNHEEIFREKNSHKDTVEHFEILMEAIKKYGKSNVEQNPSFNPVVIREPRETVDRENLADFLINDYIHNGLYEVNEKRYEKNAKGRIHWGKTVSKINPFIKDNRPFYFDTINVRKYIDDDILISAIHSIVLNQCLELRKIYKSLSIPVRREIGLDDKVMQSIVRSYMGRVFSDRDIHLMKALNAWLGFTANYEVQICGVTNFELFWEHMLKKVFDHKEDLMKMPKVKYKFKFSKDPYELDNRLEPDILREVKLKNGTTCLFILDAKYYMPKTNEESDTYSKVPAASDVAKQITYLSHLKKANVKNPPDIYFNAFLLPKFTDFKGAKIYDHLGQAYFAGFDDKDDKVQVYQIDPTGLYEKFLKTENGLNPDEMKDFYNCPSRFTEAKEDNVI